MLPLPQFVAGAGQLLLGGHGALVNACPVLVIWTALALAASILAASRRSARIGGEASVSVADPPSAPAGPPSVAGAPATA